MSHVDAFFETYAANRRPERGDDGGILSEMQVGASVHYAWELAAIDGRFRLQLAQHAGGRMLLIEAHPYRLMAPALTYWFEFTSVGEATRALADLSQACLLDDWEEDKAYH